MSGGRDDELKLPSYINKGRARPSSAQAASSQEVKTEFSARKRATTAYRYGPTKAAEKTEGRQTAAPRQEQREPQQTVHRAEQRRAANKEAKKPSKPRRPKRRINYGRLISLAAVAVALTVGLIFLINKNDEKISAIGTAQLMPEDITILDIDVGGKTKSDARHLVQDKADRLIEGAKISISCAGEKYTITGQDINLGYDMEDVLQQALASSPNGEAGRNITHIFTWNSITLKQKLEDMADSFDKDVTEAGVNPQQNADGTVSFGFTEGTPGRRLNVSQTAEYIEDMFSLGSFSFDMDAITEEVPPSITVADIQNNFGLRSTFTTEFYASTHDEITMNRVFNIEKAAGIINGCVVKPGEEWSFNTFVGLRTYDSGWKGANGIADGKGYTIQAGGGICQVSTTLYNALLEGVVEITDRRAHTIPSDYVPKGLDATVDSTGIDFCFRNDTGAPLYLYAHVDDKPDSKYKTVTFDIYGKKLEPGVRYKMRSEIVETIRRKDVKYTDDNTIPRGYKVVTAAAHDGYKAEVYRDKYVNDLLESSELLYTNTYNGNDEEARRGTASPKYYKPPEGAVKIG